MSEYREDNKIYIADTKFIYATNFAGDPNKDKFKNTSRRGNLIIPTEEQAEELYNMGFKVKQTTPREGEEEGFIPKYYVPIIIGYNHPTRKPHVYLVTNGVAQELEEGELKMLDNIRATNVCATLNPRIDEERGSATLYVSQLYVEQVVDKDPWAERYMWRDVEVDEA